ncbi:MAG: hypothetical protein IJ833_04490 [Lachnospiraceae bacterium]|nr:hypothetical protein [Lachnospiraceae bacterium]
MQLLRIFSYDAYKGGRGYLKSQRYYEIARTVLYFGISIALFVGGWLATGSRLNLLTVVAVLGCLPASKSAVSMIMYLRFSGCSEDSAKVIAEQIGELQGLYDCIFTSYEKNFSVAHMVVKGDTICGFTEDKKFEEQAFYKHLDGILKAENYKTTSLKIFTDPKKYLERLEQLKVLEADESHTEGIIATIKSVTL